MAYVEADTLLLGGIPVRSELDMASFVNDAADEIDSVLGYTYETPITKDEDGLPLAERSPVLLTLKRINRSLATGRYILAIAASGEDDTLNAYGKRLISEALDALKKIAEGAVYFDARKLPDGRASSRGPRISNAEERSNVDAFYEAYTGADNMMFGTPVPYNVGQLESE